jgi:hypothetical protein
MDEFCSLFLLAALASGTVGAVCGAVTLRQPGPRLGRIASWSGCLALLFGSISFVAHLRFGHGPAAAEPMVIWRFLRIHPAYGGVLLLSLFGFGAQMVSRPRG